MKPSRRTHDNQTKVRTQSHRQAPVRFPLLISSSATLGSLLRESAGAFLFDSLGMVYIVVRFHDRASERAIRTNSAGATAGMQLTSKTHNFSVYVSRELNMIPDRQRSARGFRPVEDRAFGAACHLARPVDHRPLRYPQLQQGTTGVQYQRR
jgi:hypothetical protein